MKERGPEIGLEEEMLLECGVAYLPTLTHSVYRLDLNLLGMLGT